MSDQNSAILPEGGKARRVYLLLRDSILSGKQPAGTLLPGEQQLAATHHVSRVTVRRALDALSNEGLIEKRAGAGSMVCSAAPTIAADMTTLIPQVVAMGRTTEARLLSFTYAPAPINVAGALGIDAMARVQQAVRVRRAEGAPFSHLTTYVPEPIAAHYSEADLAATPLFELLERGGSRIASAQQSVSATLAAPDVAEALEVVAGSALLSLTRVVYDAEGAGVEYLSALYRPDRFRLDMTMNRVGDPQDRRWQHVIVPNEKDST